MRAAVVYESTYGNTRHVAEAVAEGLGGAGDVTVIPVSDAEGMPLTGIDLVVVGAPTHVHDDPEGQAGTAASDDLVLEPGVTVAGVRQWLSSLRDTKMRAATFDTRVDGMSVITEPASSRLAGLLTDSGFQLVGNGESFLVTDEAQLLPGEEDRARRWGDQLSRVL